MTLKVHKKKAAKADAARILDQEWRTARPFGVPTLTINFNDFASYIKKGGKKYYVPLLTALITGFARKAGFEKLNLDDGIEAMENHEFNDNIMHDYTFMRNFSRAVCFPVKDKNYDYFAHQNRSVAYKEPYFNIVVLSAAQNLANNLLSYGLGHPSTSFVRDLPDFSVFSEEVHYYSRWHEYAHGTGAGEPQADNMAAAVTKKAFGSSAAIRFWTDYRAARAVLLAPKDELETYGWPMAVVNDRIADMPLDLLNKTYTDKVIKALRFETHDHKADDVEKVRHSITTEMKGNFLIAKMADVGVAARKLGNDHRVPLSAQQRTIMRRFALAAERLSTGPQAYHDNSDTKVFKTVIKSNIPAVSL